MQDLLGFHPDSSAIEGTIGGAFIAASSILYLAFTGRVTGISSIVEGFVTLDMETIRFKLAFASGLIHAAGVVVSPLGYREYYLPRTDPYLDRLPFYVLILAGLLVGFGTRLGNGCTSGHGVNGLALRSPRSLASVLSFFMTGIATAGITSKILSVSNINAAQSLHLIGNNTESMIDSLGSSVAKKSHFVAVMLLILAFCKEPSKFRDTFVSYASGMLFGIGLVYSGMSRPSRVSSFLNFGSDWDYTLIFVMLSSVLLNSIAYHFIHQHMEHPILHSVWPDEHNKDSVKFTETNTQLDFKLIGGGFLFGVGWGISGICPGPGVMLIPSGSGLGLAFFFPAMLVGMLGAATFKSKFSNDYVVPPVIPKKYKKKL